METVCQVNFSILSSKEARRTEGVLREYLLRVCDQVSMARKGSSSYSILNLIPHGYKIRKFVRKLRKEDIAEKSSQIWTFNLTDNVKNFLNQATLLLNGPGDFFYGFIDPKYKKQGKEVANLITNEQLMYLYIEDTDKAELALRGIYLDSSPI